MAKWRRQSHAKPVSTPDLSAFDHHRFVKLCAMLSSTHEGERAAAALKAADMLAAAGLTWRDVVKDQATLREQLAQEPSDDPEVRARRFWKAKPSGEKSRPRSDM
jgi:hypothetical protein